VVWRSSGSITTLRRWHAPFFGADLPPAVNLAPGGILPMETVEPAVGALTSTPSDSGSLTDPLTLRMASTGMGWRSGAADRDASGG